MKENEAEKDEVNVNRQWQEFEIKKKVRNVSIGIPTKDLDIRNIFRLLKEPICFFGEDNYDRRTRLKSVLIDRYNLLVVKQRKEKAQKKEKEKSLETAEQKNAVVTTKEELEQFLQILQRYYIDLSNFFEVGSVDYLEAKKLGEELKQKKKEEEILSVKQEINLENREQKFYTESIEELRLSRLYITLNTLPRICKYRFNIHAFQETCTKDEYENHINIFNENMKTHLELHISQLGDDRPLTRGKFSPDNNSFAVCSYNNYVSLFNYRDNNYNLITYLKNGHDDKINNIEWNYPNNYSYYSTVNFNEIERKQLLLASCSSDKSFCIWRPFADESVETVDVTNQRNKINGLNENEEYQENNTKLLFRLKAHEERINQIIFHPLNKNVMTCSEDETIKFFDIELEKELFYQEGHNTNVYTVAFNPFGNLYLSGDSLGGLMFWDIRTGRNIAKEIVHTNSIMNINFNPFFPNMFCTCSSDNTIKIFDLRSFSSTYKILAHNKIITDALYEPMYGRYIASSSFDTFIKIWDSVNFYCTKILYNNDSKVKNVDISPDGEFLASTSLDRTWKLYKNCAISETYHTSPFVSNKSNTNT